MSRQSVLMLGTEQSLDYTGDSVRGDGFYGFSDGIHTVQITVADYIGRVYIQGTLASEPVETDWFNIKVNGNNDYITYGVGAGTGVTSTLAYTFQGNMVYLRAKVERSHLGLLITEVGTLGKILLNI
tara:strand:- start:287 stop:667 length:381 start_codon:yes stop_codon:yes gene_type:complete